ncbi:MAG: hypothetical protein H6724_18400 [Sandaracinus sp.]|nr:hypothetical protein [Myxococcales bacterium]MCB9621416.1 hypothetical protein [Sandaracinus sp.]MCB9624995.1 hypothetical protein [Sandaracinus sp.]
MRPQLLALPFALSVACTASHSGTSSLDVEASIASVTLGEACGDTALIGEAPSADGDRFAGDCAEGHACGGCQQTAIQIALRASAGDMEVPFEVLSVRLLDMDGREVDVLDARSPQVYDESEGYVGWDAMIAPNESLSVRYPTTTPDWQDIGDGDEWSTYGMRFRVRVRVRIDGEERTLDFSPAMREALIVT